jgi:cell division protein FtsA
MKKRYGSVMSIYEGADESANPLSEDGHGASYQDLYDILRARVEEIIRLILLELPRSDYESLVPAGLVLTGGSSNLSGIDALGRDILKLPVRVGSPDNIYGINDALRDPAYATAVGLLMWGAKNEASPNWKSNRFSSGLRRIASQIRSFFK